MKSLESTRRAGFSLVELMAVIAILGLLAALAAGAFFRVSAAQRTSATESTVSKLMALVEKKRSAVVDGINNGRNPVPADIVTLAGGDPDRAKAIWIYMTLKNEFPTTQKEAVNAVVPIPAWSTSIPHKKVFDVLPSGTYPSLEHESAACLYLALTQSGTGGVTTDSEGLQNQTTTFTVGTTPVTAFADAWGTPVAFVRLTYTPEIDTGTYANTRAKSKDPMDPLGKLGEEVGAWTTVTGSSLRLDQFWAKMTENHLSTAGTPTSYPGPRYIPPANRPATPATRTSLLTVVSAGPDKNFGTLFGSDDAASDNIVSYRLKAGFKGQ